MNGRYLLPRRMLFVCREIIMGLTRCGIGFEESVNNVTGFEVKLFLCVVRGRNKYLRMNSKGT